MIKKVDRCLSYRKYSWGARAYVREFADREAARRDALERQHHDNRSFTGTPYPYFILDEFGAEHRASALEPVWGGVTDD